MSVSKILLKASMILQNYQSFIETTSNMIYVVALGVGLKCPRKIHLNTQCPPRVFRPSYGPYLHLVSPVTGSRSSTYANVDAARAKVVTKTNFNMVTFEFTAQ